MKAKTIVSTIVLSCLFMGCKPVNPPSTETTSNIIDLCYSSMGQSGEKLQEDLANLGINIPKINPTREYENYYIKTDSYELAFSTINDSVLILRYGIYFVNNYVEGCKKYVEMSNVLFSNDWMNWNGDAHNFYDEIEKRPDFLKEIEDWVPTWTKNQLSIHERLMKPFEDLFLWGDIHYWANMGEGRSSLAESEVFVEFHLNDRLWDN